MPFKANELRKYFFDGNHVKVLNEWFECQIDMIVRIDGTKSILLSDKTKNEVCCFRLKKKRIKLFFLIRCLLEHQILKVIKK
jgi:transcription elongation factor